MNQCIQIECHQEAILVRLQMNTESLAVYMKEQATNKLFKNRQLSYGPVADWLDILREHFLLLAISKVVVLFEDIQDNLASETSLL